MTAWTIRDERAEEAQAIASLVDAAFRGTAHADGTEGSIPERLRESGDLVLSLVAEAHSELVGHVALSPVTISDGSEGWFGLGPVSVIPVRQGEGIGTALIREGLARLHRLGAQGCVVLGAPGYYERFGFRHDPALAFRGPPPEYFMRLVLAGPAPSGEVRYPPAFG